jgi:hypothetical protein
MSSETLMLLILIVPGLVIAFVCIPKISHEFRLLELLKHPLTLIGSLFVFGLFLHPVLHNYGASDFGFISEAFMAASLIGFLLEVPHIKEFFSDRTKESLTEYFRELDTSVYNVQGDWKYIVTSANKELSHRGECSIIQNGKAIQIQGIRKTCSLNDENHNHEEVDIPWYSRWAEICNDNVLRFDYIITITEGSSHEGRHLEAICKISLNSTNLSELTGNYYVLPPFDERMQNCQWGTIRFSKLQPKAEISEDI